METAPWSAATVCKTVGTQRGNNCIPTREVGIRMNRFAHVANQKAVPFACLMRKSTEDHHGHSRTAPQAWRPGLTHVSRVAEET